MRRTTLISMVAVAAMVVLGGRSYGDNIAG